MTEKGFIVGSANGYVICYEFINDFEPKMAYKINISNKIKAIVGMSISRTQTDDFNIAIAGVYLKPVKKAKSLLHVDYEGQCKTVPLQH